MINQFIANIEEASKLVEAIEQPKILVVSSVMIEGGDAEFDYKNHRIFDKKAFIKILSKLKKDIKEAVKKGMDETFIGVCFDDEHLISIEAINKAFTTFTFTGINDVEEAFLNKCKLVDTDDIVYHLFLQIQENIDMYIENN